MIVQFVLDEDSRGLKRRVSQCHTMPGVPLTYSQATWLQQQVRVQECLDFRDRCSLNFNLHHLQFATSLPQPIRCGEHIAVSVQDVQPSHGILVLESNFYQRRYRYTPSLYSNLSAGGASLHFSLTLHLAPLVPSAPTH
jgi:hypothetical protein